jgi:hypothetical protein
VQFPDGARLTNLDLRIRWPVPVSGDAEFLCEWPAYGIAESRLTLVGDEVRAAAARISGVAAPDPGSAERGTVP